jgi:rsbT co-antagonist protein RsbR
VVKENGTLELFQAFFVSCPEMLFIARADGELLCWSDALRRALGAGIEQGRSLAKLVHPEDRDALEAAWARLKQSAGAVQFDVRLVDADGGYRALTCSASCSPAGDTVHASLRPSTDSACGKLKQRMLDSMADNINVCLWVIDADGTFLFHDGKGLALTGVKPGELLGMNLFELREYESNMPMVRRALAGELVELRFHQKEGDIHWQNWFFPVQGESGVDMVLGLSLDMSEAGRAEEELRARIQQIEKQQEVIRNLSTPIIEVWDGVLTLPMMGVVDSIRTAEVMDSVLSRVVDKQARFAILDLTGVEVVDTQVASHLIQLVTAIRLLGAEGIVAGIKPNVAQTMVSLGMDLSQIATQRNLRAALSYAIRRMGQK